jgi:hypothetical protein
MWKVEGDLLNQFNQNRFPFRIHPYSDRHIILQRINFEQNYSISNDEIMTRWDVELVEYVRPSESRY